MRNVAKCCGAGGWLVAIGRVILALAMISGGAGLAGAAANRPLLSGITPNPDSTPTWSWSSGGGGIGTYRYTLDASIYSGGATITTATGFTPAAPLPEGRHTLHVQERDAAGNWSPVGTKAIVVDTIPPAPPQLRGVTPTRDPTPTWSWVGGVTGSGIFRYALDLDDLAVAPETTARSYTPATPLSEGAHTLHVQERDRAGNWSLSAGMALVIDLTRPFKPLVSGVTPTSDPTPTWSWAGGGGGNATFRYNLDTRVMAGVTPTTDVAYTPEIELGEGIHTLYVQERDSAGNWSASGQMAIEILAPPMPPTLPDTGQTTSYTETFGEDHDYTINPPSYTVSVYGTVTDNVTGLMWQQENDSLKRTWANALTYCDTLGLAKYSDWRLPTSRELTGILNLGRINPPLSTTIFPCSYSSFYWTATPSVSHPGFAWIVDFANGFVLDFNATGTAYARCVRGGE